MALKRYHSSWCNDDNEYDDGDDGDHYDHYQTQGSGIQIISMVTKGKLLIMNSWSWRDMMTMMVTVIKSVFAMTLKKSSIALTLCWLGWYHILPGSLNRHRWYNDVPSCRGSCLKKEGKSVSVREIIFTHTLLHSLSKEPNLFVPASKRFFAAVKSRSWQL